MSGIIVPSGSVGCGVGCSVGCGVGGSVLRDLTDLPAVDFFQTLRVSNFLFYSMDLSYYFEC